MGTVSGIFFWFGGVSRKAVILLSRNTLVFPVTLVDMTRARLDAGLNAVFAMGYGLGLGAMGINGLNNESGVQSLEDLRELARLVIVSLNPLNPWGFTLSPKVMCVVMYAMLHTTRVDCIAAQADWVILQ